MKQSGQEDRVQEAIGSPGRPTHSEDGVDLTMIRWMLSLTPAERLQVLQQFVRSVQRVRNDNPHL
jgi:hypothetical protein